MSLFHFYFVFSLLFLFFLGVHSQATINVVGPTPTASSIAPQDTSSPSQLQQGQELGNQNSLQLIQTSMILTPPFECNNQLEQCFTQRFTRCFSQESWFLQREFTVGVYRSYLPQEAKNVSTAPYVIVVFQLLMTSNNANSASAAVVVDLSTTSSLLNSAGTGTKNEAKCTFAGLASDGFKLLQPWKEPLPPPGELSENWFGIGMSILCAFIPCIFVSLNVYRRWKKITKSNRNFLKVMKDLKKFERRKEKSGSSSTSSSSSSRSSSSADSDFDESYISPKQEEMKNITINDINPEAGHSHPQNLSLTASASGTSHQSGEESK